MFVNLDNFIVISILKTKQKRKKKNLANIFLIIVFKKDKIILKNLLIENII